VANPEPAAAASERSTSVPKSSGWISLRKKLPVVHPLLARVSEDRLRLRADVEGPVRRLDLAGVDDRGDVLHQAAKSGPRSPPGGRGGAILQGDGGDVGEVPGQIDLRVRPVVWSPGDQDQQPEALPAAQKGQVGDAPDRQQIARAVLTLRSSLARLMVITLRPWRAAWAAAECDSWQRMRGALGGWRPELTTPYSARSYLSTSARWAARTPTISAAASTNLLQVDRSLPELGDFGRQPAEAGSACRRNGAVPCCGSGPWCAASGRNPRPCSGPTTVVVPIYSGRGKMSYRIIY